MKKLAVLAAIVVVAALAAPAFSATNPFMDVPMGHWAYDAIGQLASENILAGYEDGEYKGTRPTTRYEMASALARMLGVIDMKKASKQEIEALRRLVMEFDEELETLGVRVDELDERIAVYETRLGGWHLSGVLALEVINRSANNALDVRDSDGHIQFDDAKLLFERTWGENDEYYFRARLSGGGAGNVANFDRFYVEMPFFFDTKFMLGRNNWAWEGAYKIDLPNTGSWMGDQILTDWGWAGFGLTKNFGLGTASIAFAHPDQYGDRLSAAWQRAWMILAGAQLQFTEQFGFDIGGQAFIGDNAEQGRNPGDAAFNNLWTIYAGLRFNFNENVALKGVFYHQKIDTEEVNGAGTAWEKHGYGIQDGNSFLDDANHWAAIIDVKQEALKYTSLWLEYGQYKKGFMGRNNSTIFYSGSPIMSGFIADGNGAEEGGAALTDINYYRIGLGQEWNEKWATHLFYYGYIVKDGKAANDDAKPFEVGLGVQYKMNDYTTMGLNYVHADNNLDGNDNKDNVIRFRTKVTF